MSKELTPLQALEQVKYADVYIGGNAKMPLSFTKQYRIIGTALNENEKQLKTLKSMYGNLEKLLVQVNTEKEKYRQAIKILKEWFEVFEDENGYHLRTLFDIGRITDKEGKLLEEILK